MSRVEAEAMLMADGEFLIRESTKKTGQYVLTGMAASKPQHLLLMDKEGKVCSVCVIMTCGGAFGQGMDLYTITVGLQGAYGLRT